MFIGTFYHHLEAKGRVSLPKKFREQETNWIVTRGLDGGLFVFRESQFGQHLQELEERSLTKKMNRDFIRLMTNEASQISVDNNGRVQLPEYLIKFADLTKDIVILGSYRWIEIWDVNKYHEYRDTLEDQAEAIAEQLITPTYDE